MGRETTAKKPRTQTVTTRPCPTCLRNHRTPRGSSGSREWWGMAFVVNGGFAAKASSHPAGETMLKLHAAMLAAALVLALTLTAIAFPPYFTWKVASWWTAMALITGGVVALYAIHFPALDAVARKMFK